jgi:S1-C subfamily serine protease
VRRDTRLFAFALAVAVVVVACDQPSPIVTTSDIEESVVRIAGTACLKPILATGFVVADGLVVTVAHATAGAEDDLRVIDAFGASHDVEIVAFDDQLDIVVMSVDGLSGTAIRPASAQPGDTGVITAMVSGSGIEFIEYEVLRIVNARSGDIYDVGRVERAAIDVLTAAKRGTSGAPLLDDAADYIGMVFAISRDRENGVYALASSEIVDYLATLPIRIPAERGRCR